MKNLRKALTFAAVTLVAAVSLLTIKPIRAWASTQGDYIYHQFILRGPAYVFKSTVGGAQGIRISTGAYAGASQTGVPTAPTGTTDIVIVGGQTTAARTACAAGIEGQIIYDPTVHSIAFCDGTNWHKLVYTLATNADAWTAY